MPLPSCRTQDDFGRGEEAEDAWPSRRCLSTSKNVGFVSGGRGEILGDIGGIMGPGKGNEWGG